MKVVMSTILRVFHYRPHILFLATLLMIFLGGSGTAHAVPVPATVIVTNTDDSGDGSLRDAIAEAASGDTIDFSVTGTITLTTGQLSIDKDLTIDGPGSGSLTIDGNASGRIFNIGSGNTVSISGLTLTNGRTLLFTPGGAISNSGALLVSDSVIEGNKSGGFSNGGGIYSNLATLVVIDSIIRGNVADEEFGVGNGGGIFINGGSAVVQRSTVSGNSTAGDGGGIYSSLASLDIEDSTISGNTAFVGGGIVNVGGTLVVTRSTISGNAAGECNCAGGIRNINSGSNIGTLILDNSTVSGNTAGSSAGIETTGPMVITNSTITGNIASFGTGGFLASGSDASVTLVNAIIADNTGSPPDCQLSASAILISSGNNLIGDDSGCSFTPAAGDLVGTTASPIDPLLGPLQDNGGPTETHALHPGSPSNAASPAMDAGDNATAPATDQRGVSRPQPAGGQSDIGAFEVAVGECIILSPDPFTPLTIAAGTDLVLTATVFADINLDGSCGQTPVAFVPVTFFFDGDFLPATSTPILTDSGGQAVITLNRSVAGSEMVRAGFFLGCCEISTDTLLIDWTPPPLVELTASPEGPPDAAAINPVGTAHTVTATLTRDGAPFADEIIDFGIVAGPNIGATSSVVTDVNGEADFTYTDTGFDTFNDDIIGVQWRGDAGSLVHVVKRWVSAPPLPGPSEPFAISLFPTGTIDVLVGTLQVLRARVTNIDGLPLEDVGVSFTTFGFDVLGNDTTSAAGIAEISFTRLVPGEDIVRASFLTGCCPQGSEDLIINWVGDFDGDGIGDPTDPEPFGQHADPTFSQVPNAPDGVCICTPPMMNNQGGELQRPGPQVQNWFVKDDGSGDVDVTLTLSVVNPIEAGFHTMRVYNSSNFLVAGPVTLQYHSNINLPALASTSTTLSIINGGVGEVYRVELTVEGDPLNPDVPRPDPLDPPTPGIEVVARHYELKFNGAIEAGMGSPSLRQIEAAPATWFLNVDAGEAPQIRVASTGLTAGAETATIELRDPSGALVDSASPSGGLFDELLTGASSTTAGQWSLTVSGLDHHYWVDKLSGSDRGIYLTWLSFGFGAIDVDLGGFAGTVGLDIERLGPGATSTVFSGTFPSTSSLPLLAPGAYRVTVTPPPGFDVTPTSIDIFVGCKATTLVQFQLDAQPVDPLPVLTVHKIVVNDDGGGATTTDFTMTVDGNPVPTGTQIVLSPGTYTVGETGPFGYEGTIGGDCNANGNITLALGDDKTCTITNDDIAPTITLVKQVINDDGGIAGPNDFNLIIGGSGVLSGATTTVRARAPITIDETVSPGYTFVSITGTSTFGGVSCPALLGGTVFLHEGDEITCTIVNDDIAPTLTVHKVVVNDDGGTATSTDFLLIVDGSFFNFGQQIALSAATHTISELSAIGYEGTISGDCDANGNITLAVGDDKTCAITNDDIAPTITLVKQVINDDGGTAGPNDFSLTIGGVGVASGATTSVMAGTPITIDETLGAGYTFVSMSGQVQGSQRKVKCPGLPGGTITLLVGERITCTITNDDFEPTLTVHKVVINDDGGAATTTDFFLRVDGGFFIFGQQIPLSVGTHTISELSAFGYEGTIGGDCDANGNITLAFGDDKTCTITNDDIAPTITLVKQVINDDGGIAGPNDFSLTIGGSGVASGVAIQVTARTPIAIDEKVGAGYTFVSITGTSVFGGVSCPAVLGGTVTLHEGDEIICVIVNDDIAPPPPPPPTGADPRTIGYWKNHQGHILDLITATPIGILTVPEIVDILRNANAKDARNALSAQRMATVLNLRNGTDPGGIGTTVNAAQAFLIAHIGVPVTRKHPDRDEALDMKDLLDAYNNSGE